MWEGGWAMRGHSESPAGSGPWTAQGSYSADSGLYPKGQDPCLDVSGLPLTSSSLFSPHCHGPNANSYFKPQWDSIFPEGRPLHIFSGSRHLVLFKFLVHQRCPFARGAWLILLMAFGANLPIRHADSHQTTR